MPYDHPNLEELLAPTRNSITGDRKVIRVKDIPVRPTRTWDISEFGWLIKTRRQRCEAGLDKVVEPVALVAFMETVPVLSPTRRWSLIEHSAGGHLSSSLRMVATTLDLKRDVQEHLTAMVRHFCCHKEGWWSPDTTLLDDLFEYRRWITDIGLDCNNWYTYRYLQEAFYPADLSQAAINAIAEEPFDLDSLLGEPKPLGGIEGYAIIAVLAENSD